MPWSRNTIWRQGSVLSPNDFQSLGLTNTPATGLAIAISHDCDIAHDNLDAEPAIEFIFSHILEERDGNYTHGKNPRILHLDYIHDGQTIWIELIASRRVVVQKILLEESQPDESYTLTTHSQKILQSWLAVRYRRQALPNSLVDRLAAVSKHLEKKGKNNSSGILSFRLSYEPKDELPPEEPYELWLSIVYITDEPKYRSISEDLAHSLKTEFPTLLEKTRDKGTVDLRKCDAVSEMEFTLRDMRETVEYNLEHLSYRTEPSGPIV